MIQAGVMEKTQTHFSKTNENYVLECKTRLFSLNLALKYVSCLKLAYEVPNQIALKQPLGSQTEACITKSSWDLRSCGILQSIQC